MSIILEDSSLGSSLYGARRGAKRVGEITTETQREKRTNEVENLGAGTFFPQAGTTGTLKTERDLKA